MAVSIGITERGDAALDDNWKKWVYDEQKPAILITKNPKKLISENRDLFFGELKGNVILHATITGLGGTVFEPNVMPFSIQLNFLKDCLADTTFHKERIVIRHDPLIPHLGISNESYKNSMITIAKFAKDNGLRYRTSFFDYYNHVRDRFDNIIKNNDEWAAAINTLNHYQKDLHLSLDIRLSFLDFIKTSGLTDEEIEICGEPQMACSGCLSIKDLNIFGLSIDEITKNNQRAACACLGLKKELLTNKHPCAHKCAYCYWKD